MRFIPKQNHAPKSKIIACVLLSLSLSLILIKNRRTAFGLQPEINYHHWLLAHNQISSDSLPIVTKGDPVFFPNSVRMPSKTYFWIEDAKKRNIYKNFSSRINLVNSVDLKNFDIFTFIGKEEEINAPLLEEFKKTRIKKIHKNLDLWIFKFVKIKGNTNF